MSTQYPSVPSPVTLSLALAGGPSAASAARAALGPLANDLAPRLFDELELLVSELVTNSFRHGGAGPDDWIRVDVLLSVDGVRAEIADVGPGFEPGEPPQVPRDGGGWGLFMVEQL